MDLYVKHFTPTSLLKKTSRVMERVIRPGRTGSPPLEVTGKCNNERCRRIHGSSDLVGIIRTIIIPIIGAFIRESGRWSCKTVTEDCPKPNFNYQYSYIPYVCPQPCLERSVFNTTKTNSCYRASCGRVQENIPCLMEKEMCKQARKLALNDTSKTNIIAPRILGDLANAQSNASLWAIKKQKAKLKFQSALRTLNASRYAVLNLERAFNITVNGREKRMKILEKPLKLTQLLDEKQKSLVLLNVERIGFNVRVTAEQESTLLSLHITYMLNGTRQKLSSVLDFNNIDLSLKSMAKEIISKHVGDMSHLSRRRRSVDNSNSLNPIPDQKTHTLQTFHEKCSEFHNKLQVVRGVIMTLHQRASEEELTHQVVAKRMKKTMNANANDPQINLNQTVALEFGLDIYNVSLSKDIETDPIIQEAKALQKEVISNSYEPIRSSSTFFFKNWMASMETAFQDFSIECNGFEDCLKQTVDNLLEIGFDNRPTGDFDLHDQINAIWKMFSNLTEQQNIELSDLVHSTSKILKIIKSTANNTKICARPPNITQHPEAYKVLREDEELVLTCNATGDSLKYQWKFNGEILINQSANVLHIRKTTSLHSGKYLCEAFNRVDKVSSSPSTVVIAKAPTIIREPQARSFLIISNFESLVCQTKKNEHNTSYQWWFKPSSSKNYIALQNGVFSHLSIGPVKMEDQGLYFCNVSNKFGFTLSRITRVYVLNYSLPVPAATLSFTVIKEYREANNAMPSKPVLSYQEPLQKSLASSPPFKSHPSYLSPEKRIKELTPERCQVIYGDNHEENAVEICDWSVKILGSNVTSSKQTQHSQKISQAFLDLKGFVGELKQTSNSGLINFFHGSANYSMQKTSMIAKEFTLVCPIGQQLITPVYKCVNCPSGWYGKLKKGNSICVPCPIGFYQEKSGKTFCHRCPKGFTTRGKGSHERQQCKDERKFFLIFKLVNKYGRDVRVNMVMSSTFQSLRLTPNKPFLHCKGWKAKKSVTLTAVDPSTNKTIDIEGQSEIRLLAKTDWSTLDVLHIQDKQPGRKQSSATFVVVSRYHNPVLVTATISLRTRKFMVYPGSHVWFFASQSSQFYGLFEIWTLKAVDVRTSTVVSINGETSIFLVPGVIGSPSVLFIDGT